MIKALQIALLLLSSAALNAQIAPLTLSPALLKAAFNSPTDSTDYFIAAHTTGIQLALRNDRSVYLLDRDTVLRPEQGDELQSSYQDSLDAKAAYASLYQYASDGGSSLFKALQAGAFVGRSGDTVTVHWHTHDYQRLDDRPVRRRFRSTEFIESFEIFQKLIRLK